jgi:hypothetical protein
MLDCLTPVGRRWINHQDHAISVILQAHPQLRASVPEDLDSLYDVIFYLRDIPVSVAEVKSRKNYTDEVVLTESMVVSRGYLITAEKIKKLREMSARMCVPSMIIVNLIAEGKVLVIRLTDKNGHWVPFIEWKKGLTKKTCNGGTATRYNAIIYPNADNMRVYHYSMPSIPVIPG